MFFKKFRWGIQSRLITAFVIVAGMAVGSAVVAWFSVNTSKNHFSNLVNTTLPIVAKAQVLVNEINLFSYKANDLAYITTESERLALEADLALGFQKLVLELTIFDSLDYQSNDVAFLKQQLDNLVKNIEQQSKLARSFIQIREKSQEAIENLQIKHLAFIQTVNPRIEEGYKEFLRKGNSLGDHMRKALHKLEKGVHPADVKDLEQEIHSGLNTIVSMEAGEMRANLKTVAVTNLAVGLLNETVNTKETNQVLELKKQFDENRKTMEKLISAFAHGTPRNQQILATALPLIELGHGPGNIFDLHMQMLEIRRAVTKVAKKNSDLASELTETVNSLVVDAQITASEASLELDARLFRAQILQTMAATLAMIVAILIGWIYVSRSVVKPLQILRETMEKQAVGENVPIPSEANDEIGDMARALRHFVEQRRQAEINLRNAKEMAEQADKAKSQFLTNMSHEIRTPMNSILGMTDLLGETELSNHQKELIQTLNSSGELLLSIINDILDMSKIEAGQIELETIPFDLVELSESIAGIMANRGRDKGLEMIYRVSPDVFPFRSGDPTRIRQLLVNLIGNAVKFTDEGEIIVEIENAEDPISSDLVLFSVRDSGIGIPYDRQQMIFDNFSQADPSVTRKFGGTGLGLAITRQLVELMNGKIWLDSQPGEGTAFYFTLRLPKTHVLHKKKIEAPPELSETRVLVVDDHQTNRKLFREHILSLGAKCETALNSELALQKIRKGIEEKQPFQLVLMDCIMPGMDGITATEQICEFPLAQRPKVILLNEHGNPKDPARSDELPIVDILKKPIKAIEFNSRVLAALGYDVQKLVSTVPENKDNEWNKKPSILVAEDIEANRKVIDLYLREIADMRFVGNGREALGLFKKESFDLVLMDMQMPIMDGYEATKAIREWEASNNLGVTPIVALTAYAFEPYQVRCLEAGCTDFLAKPVKRDDILRTIDKLLVGNTQLSSGENTNQEDVRMRQQSENSGDQVKTDKHRVKIDKVFESLLPDFFEEIKENLIAMNEAANQSDFATLKRLGHGFKGAARNYQFSEMAKLFLAIERSAEVGDADEAQKQLENLEYYIANVEIIFED